MFFYSLEDGIGYTISPSTLTSIKLTPTLAPFVKSISSFLTVKGKI